MQSDSRSQEHDRLCSMIDQGLNVAVVGRHGMGKTELLSRIVRESRGPVVQIVCNPAESAVRLSGMDIVLAALRVLRMPETLEDLEQILASGAPAAAMADSLVARIRRSAELPRALVVIDDVDQMDGVSQEILGHLLRRLTGLPLRTVVVARRIGQDSPLAGIPAVELLPLDRTASVALAHTLVPEPLCEDAALTAATAAGGSPLALRHVLQMMTERQRRGDAPFPQPLRTSEVGGEFAREVLDGIGAEAREVLSTLALAPLTSVVSLRRRHPALKEELFDLQSSGLVERVGPCLRISDALVRSHLYWALSPTARREGRAAAVSAEAGETPMCLWHRSFSDFDEDTAAGLLRAARTLLRQGHREAALEFAERALMLAPDPAELAAPLLDLAELLSLCGDSVLSDRYVRFARTSDAPAVQLCALRISVQTDYHRRQAVPSGGARFWGPREIAEAPDEVAAVQTVLALCHVERYELTEAEELLTAAGELAESFSPVTRTTHECVWMMLEAYRGDSARTLAQFHTLSGLDQSVGSAFAAVATARALIVTEHYAEARSVLELLEHRLPDASMWLKLLPVLRADLEVRAGQFQLVQPYAEEARRRQGPDEPLREDQLLLLECRLLLMRGRAGDADALEQTLMRRAGTTRNRSVLAQLSALQGSYLLQAGLPAEALWHLQRCEELASGGLAPNVLRHEPELIEALLRLGRREHALLLLQRFRKRLDRFPSRWGELAAQRCEALLETGERSLELLRRSLRAMRPADSDHERARTVAAYAQRLRELGAPGEAAEQRAAATALFHSTGDLLRAQALAPAADPEPRQAPAEHPLLAKLTEDERTVVELVREGCRNRDIAERIYVSLRTVEIRLTSVYRRFGVRSRTELLAKLASAPESLPA
ncbi:helix-turn-helix transcriptional regulator [Brevibacterium album]|uniref:helix-turn-helix transcriptional regulator n=1 Tax=Brevibacterium album TaxID=417948 RepID=UPI0003F7325A|nr:LuxR family transcriptional regulator [Brevibacterium album]